MALINPRTLYTGGDVALDSTPYRVAYQRQQQIKQAREDALDKYYQNLPNTVNDKGVRDQEIPVINNAKDQLQQYWMQNKDAIKKGNTPQNYNYQKMIRDIQGVIQESKNRAATSAKIATLRGNPKYDYIFRDPKLVEQIQAHDEPIGADGSTGINFNQLTLPPAPFDQQKYLGNFTGQHAIKPTNEITYQPIDGDRFNRTQISTPKLSSDDLNKIHISASTELANNPSFEKYLKENVLNDEVKTAALSKLFQEKYGHPVQDESDVAAAYTLSQLPFNPQTKVVKNDEGAFAAKDAQWYAHNAVTDRQHKANIALNQGATGANLNINDVYQRLQDNQDNGDINTTDESGKPIKAARFNSLSNDVQGIIMQGLKQIDKYANGDNVYQIKEPDGSIGIYKTDADGVPRPSKATRLTTITRTGINIKAQPDVKAKRAVVAQENENKSSKAKPVVSPSGYSKADLKANGWSDEQINKAVKAGKIKIN